MSTKKQRLKVKKVRLNRSWGGTFGIFLGLALVAVFLLLPFVLSAVNAFKPIDEIMIFPPRFYVQKPTINNFIQLGRLCSSFWVPISRYIFNSLFVSIVATVAHILFASMAAYPLSKHKFIGKKTINNMINWALLFTGPVVGIPLYIVMANLHMINTYWAMILPTVASTLGLYLMIQFMGQFETTILEAARIDGTSEFGIYWRIVMPNMKPAWITAMIFAFQGIWNSTGGIYIYEESLKMLPSVMQQIAGGGIARTGATAAASLLMMIPPVLLFFVSQNFIIETMSSSGMK